MICFLKKIFKKKSYKEYLKSLDLSKNALDDFRFKDGCTPLYFSQRWYNLFLSTFSIKPKISSSVSNNVSSTEKDFVNVGLTAGAKISSGYSEEHMNSKSVVSNYGNQSEIETIKENVSRIKEYALSIEDAKVQHFFVVNFPVFHGELIILNDIQTNTYLWNGKYRNFELFLVGNTKNILTRNFRNTKKAVWDPSEFTGPKKILKDLEKLSEDCDYYESFQKKYKDNTINILKENVKESVMNRGYWSYSKLDKGQSFYEWHEMIVYCTEIIEKENGIKQILGVPVFVIPSNRFGYGWYNINHAGRYGENYSTKYHPNDKEFYYEFDNKNFTGRVLKQINSSPFRGYEVNIIDVNDAYKVGQYEIIKDKNLPDIKLVEKCDDIIGISIEKDLLEN